LEKDGKFPGEHSASHEAQRLIETEEDKKDCDAGMRRKKCFWGPGGRVREGGGGKTKCRIHPSIVAKGPVGGKKKAGDMNGGGSKVGGETVGANPGKKNGSLKGVKKEALYF